MFEKFSVVFIASYNIIVYIKYVNSILKLCIIIYIVGSAFASSIETGGLLGRIAAGYITDRLIQLYIVRYSSLKNILCYYLK